MRMPRFTPSPALVIACLALVVAGTPPVAAAVSALVPKDSVGTAQLKDGAVTTPKLHGGAVTNRKIAPGTITGGRIADGSVGLLDLTASARPRPPKAFSAVNDLTYLPDDSTHPVVATLNLPAGTWVINAKTVATFVGDTTGVAGGDSVGCHLFAGEQLLDFSSVYLFVNSTANYNSQENLPLAAMVTLGGPTEVTMRCFDQNDGRTAYIQSTKLVAVQVTP